MLWAAAELLIRKMKLKETDMFSKIPSSVLPNDHLNQFPMRIFVSLYTVRLKMEILTMQLPRLQRKQTKSLSL